MDYKVDYHLEVVKIKDKKVIKKKKLAFLVLALCRRGVEKCVFVYILIYEVSVFLE